MVLLSSQSHVDQVRNRPGAFRRYGHSVMVVVEKWMAEALGMKPGSKYWIRVAPDNRSFTVHLDPPSNGKSAPDGATAVPEVENCKGDQNPCHANCSH